MVDAGALVVVYDIVYATHPDLVVFDRDSRACRRSARARRIATWRHDRAPHLDDFAPLLVVGLDPIGVVILYGCETRDAREMVFPPSLKTLRLASMSFSNRLPVHATHPALESLDLDAWWWSKDYWNDMSYTVFPSTLKHLRLMRVVFRTKATCLENLVDLETLDLDECVFWESHFLCFEKSRHLRSLKLTLDFYDMRMVAPIDLTTTPHLEHLEIRGWHVDDIVCGHITALKSLKSLDLRDTGILGETMEVVLGHVRHP